MKKPKNPILDKLRNIHKITDEQWEQFKHLKTVYVYNANTNQYQSGLKTPWEGKITEFTLTREDYSRDFDGDIYIKKINPEFPITSYKLFESWDEAYVAMYENHQKRMIEKLQRELRELEAFTEKYKEILNNKPHLGI